MTGAAYGKRVVALRGNPYTNEDGVASGTIKPGQLVDGVGTIIVHGTAGGNTPRAFALERSELGTGIDASYPGIPALTETYATSDTVKVGVFHPGQRVTARIASGQNISINDKLESAGNGTLRKYNSGTILGRSLEGPGTVAAETLLAIEIM